MNISVIIFRKRSSELPDVVLTRKQQDAPATAAKHKLESLHEKEGRLHREAQAQTAKCKSESLHENEMRLHRDAQARTAKRKAESLAEKEMRLQRCSGQDC